MAFDAIMWAKLKNCASLRDGKIPSEQLPSYIDDVVEVPSYSNLPQPGLKSVIYYTVDTQQSWRWGSSRYILITSDNFDELVTKDQIDKFITAEYVDEQINSIDYSDFATKSDVDKKISEIDIPSVAGLASEQYVQDKISEIDIPEIPENLSQFNNDVGYIRADDIPKIDLSDYYTKSDTESLVNEAVAGINIPDTSNFITMKDVEDKGYLTEHQSLDGYALKSDIPDVSNFVTQEDIDSAIENIEIPLVDTSKFVTNSQLLDMLADKSDEIPFTENYTVGLAEGLGGFKNGDSLKNLTIKQILIQLLNLSIYEPSEPDIPSQGDITVDNIEKAYTTKDGGITFELVDNNIITDNTASGYDKEGIFVDDSGNIGYQIQLSAVEDDSDTNIYVDSKYVVTDIQQWNDSKKSWASSNDISAWIWDESPTLITVNVDGKDVEMRVYTYDIESYGGRGASKWRFIVDLA